MTNMTPKELRKISSSRPGDTTANAEWARSAGCALKYAADEIDELHSLLKHLHTPEIEPTTGLSTASNKAVEDFGIMALQALDARDLDEDPIGYCICRDGFMDLTCASRVIEIVKHQAFIENKWHPKKCIVVPLFSRPSVVK